MDFLRCSQLISRPRCAPARRLLTLAVLLAACTAVTESELDYERALARWRRAGISDYSFKSTVSCFCAVEYTAAKTVTVRNGIVVSVVDRRTGVVHRNDIRTPIDSLFAMIREELATRPTSAEAAYDPTLGYPRRLKYGTPENDGGGFIFVDSVVIGAR